ncbi:large subunit ribosomal protein L12e [Strigomonas culicis]|uniref:Large subunit ribosomal protein L12e n=1 Tax=Strigomonas culicis TaxID=28005 RepID=S9UMX4_9TRYP|nr:large subunit ribosomal protein L12e [Strigomonas culicis]|eukprot:EPY30283.1 large subunit ribosomal protein L12e [Strigomonas culicis]
MVLGLSPSMRQPMETAVPSTSSTTDLRFAPMDLALHSSAILSTSEKAMLPSCLMFFTFLRSRAGSLSARMRREAADGVTMTVATRFFTRSSQVTFRPFQSLVALAMSSPIFFAFRPRGPTLGAREAVAATSPPTARTMTVISTLGSNFGGISNQVPLRYVYK